MHLLAFKARKAAKGGNSPTTSGAPPPPNLDNQVGAELGMGEATPPTHVIDESNVETKRKKPTKNMLLLKRNWPCPRMMLPGLGVMLLGLGPENHIFLHQPHMHVILLEHILLMKPQNLNILEQIMIKKDK